MSTSWWFFTNPSEKYAQVKLDHETPNWDENKKCLKPPPRVYLEILSGLLPFAHLFTYLWTMLEFSSVWETLTQFSGLTKKRAKDKGTQMVRAKTHLVGGSNPFE